MKVLVYIMLGLGLLVTALFLYVRVKSGGLKAALIKGLASIFFILTAVMSSLANNLVPYSFAILVVLGLVFGLVGDILLDLKLVYPKDNDIYLYSGMASFALGHVSYLTAIYIYMTSITGALIPLTLILPLGVSILFACAAVLGGPIMGLNYGKFKVPSFIYAFLLSFMMFASVAGLIVAVNKLVWIVLLIGAILFVISDLILSQQYFTVKEEVLEDSTKVVTYPKAKTPILVIINHITYYLAQFLIALSILFYI